MMFQGLILNGKGLRERMDYILIEHIEKTLSVKRLYEGKIINVRVDTVSLPGGGTATREVVEHAGAVGVVPVNEQGEILLVRQYRYAAGKTLLEIPAGKLEPGEDPLACARRELLEETGYAASGCERLISFYSTPGFTNETLYLFLATGLTQKEQNLDEDEDIAVVPVPFEQAIDFIWSGEICDAKSVAGIFAVYYREKNKPGA
ncbi:MAG: ADP-ribose pyrophosphatase [Pelotomaculum sp. PtaB.Bin104]|nr:MAG: ADP-ribose pyrophosphatase [Pelotomaculum sp. PtaB.Bin104]